MPYFPGNYAKLFVAGVQYRAHRWTVSLSAAEEQVTVVPGSARNVFTLMRGFVPGVTPKAGPAVENQAWLHSYFVGPARCEVSFDAWWHSEDNPFGSHNPPIAGLTLRIGQVARADLFIGKAAEDGEEGFLGGTWTFPFVVNRVEQTASARSATGYTISGLGLRQVSYPDKT